MMNLGLVVALVVLSASLSFGQTKQAPVSVTGKKVEATRGASKYERPTTDVVAPQPDNSRGSCCLNFDNYTGYYVDVWVDGTYRGRVSPYDYDGLCVGDGYTTWYAETAGGTYYWEGSGNCSGTYTLNLK